MDRCKGAHCSSHPSFDPIMKKFSLLALCVLAAELPAQGPGYADTSLDAYPPATTWVPNAHFAFSSNEPAATFEYRIDGGAWTPTSESYAVFAQRTAGAHSFEVRAVLNGLPDLTPESYGWTVTQAVSASEASLTDDGALFPTLGEDVYTGYNSGQGETYFADGGGPSGPDPFFLGTTEDLLALISPISANGTVVSATTEEYPGGVIHSAAGGPEDYVGPGEPGDLLSQPCVYDFDGHRVWQLRMRSYTSGVIQDEVRDEELPVAIAEYEGSPDGAWSTAFVTHAINVDETDIGQYELLFSLLDSHGITLENLSDVMARYPYTATPPDLADVTYICDEPRSRSPVSRGLLPLASIWRPAVCLPCREAAKR